MKILNSALMQKLKKSKRENMPFSEINYRQPYETENGRIDNSQIPLFINLIFYLLTFGIFFRFHLSIDSYSTLYNILELPFHQVSSGRFFGALISFLLTRLGINVVLHQWFSTALLILSLSASTTILTLNFFHQKLSNLQRIIINLAFLIPGISVFFTEWFMFPEASYQIGIGLFLCVLAIIEVQRHKSLSSLLAFVLLFLSLSIYQVFVEFFVIYAFCFICRDMGTAIVKKTIFRIVSFISIALGASILNIVVAKIVSNLFNVPMSTRSAVFSVDVIKENITKLLALQPHLWKTGLGLLPKYIMLIFFLLLVGFVFHTVLLKGNLAIKQKLIFLCLFAISLITSFVPHYISPAFWPAPRTLIALFACFALAILFVNLYSKNQIVLYFLLIICFLFISINYAKIQRIGEDQIITNALDKSFALTIDEAIRDYESANNFKVSKIVTQNDASPQYGYYQYVENITYDTNVSARVASWSTVPMINFYTGRNLVQFAGDPAVFEEKLNLDNMDALDLSKQVYFEEDTLYLVVY